MPTSTSDFIKDLAKLRKPLQQKLKKEVSWIWTTNDTKMKTSKRCVKIFPSLICLTKEMIYFLKQMPAMSTGVQYSKSKKEKNSRNIVVEVLIRQNATIL